MKRALHEYSIRGVKTSIPFHQLMMDHEKFVAGEYDTTFIDRVLKKIEYRKHHQVIAAIAGAIDRSLSEQRTTAGSRSPRGGVNPWKMAGRRSMMRRM
jgi:acetyl/propionyl-CoA carboxylase alpha subunit